MNETTTAGPRSGDTFPLAGGGWVSPSVLEPAGGKLTVAGKHVDSAFSRRGRWLGAGLAAAVIGIALAELAAIAWSNPRSDYENDLVWFGESLQEAAFPIGVTVAVLGLAAGLIVRSYLKHHSRDRTATLPRTAVASARARRRTVQLRAALEPDAPGRYRTYRVTAETKEGAAALARALTDHGAAAPTAAVTRAVPAEWLPDPTARHEHRYWDGERWTDLVADGGVQSSDPLTPAPDRELVAGRS